jgi:hypothetical protein
LYLQQQNYGTNNDLKLSVKNVRCKAETQNKDCHFKATEFSDNTTLGLILTATRISRKISILAQANSDFYDICPSTVIHFGREISSYS